MHGKILVFVYTLLAASLPGHAASKIHGREYSEGPNCFNIQPHHHFDQTLRFRNQCSLDVTGLYCFVDTGSGHGTCENGENHPLLRSDKTAWPEQTALEEFRKAFEKNGRRITVKGGKKKNLANLDFKTKLTGVIWSVCYVEDIATGKCRIKPASQLWREKSAPPKQAKKPEPKSTVPKLVAVPEQPTAPQRVAKPGTPTVPPSAKPTQPTAAAQMPESDCVSFFDVEVCGDGWTKEVFKWIDSALDIGYLLYTIKAGATGVLLVLAKVVTVWGAAIYVPWGVKKGFGLVKKIAPN